MKNISYSGVNIEMVHKSTLPIRLQKKIRKSEKDKRKKRREKSCKKWMMMREKDM